MIRLNCWAVALSFAISAAWSADAAAQARSPQPPVYGFWLTEPKSKAPDASRARVEIGTCPDPTKGPVCGWIVDLLGTVRRKDGTPIDKANATDQCPGQAGTKLLPDGAHRYYLLTNYKLSTNGTALEDGKVHDLLKCETHDIGISLQASDGSLKLGPWPLAQYWTRK